jgi:hypothetical protein
MYREVHLNCRKSREFVNFSRQKSFVVHQEIFSAGAKPAQKLEATMPQTSHEIRPVQLQAKSVL